MAAAGLLAVQLGSTPPLATPARAQPCKRCAGPGSNVVVGFRSSDDEVGGMKSSWSRSVPGAAAHGLSRSVGRPRPGSEGLTAARPLVGQMSIPRSATFVKVEGFQTPAEACSPVASPPASPQPKTMGSSLLSRQLERDVPVGLDEPSLLVQRLERAVVRDVQPTLVLPHRPQRRVTVPDDLLEQLQSLEETKVFREPLVARAFSLSRSAHDGQYRASGDPAFLHCVAVARILAAMGANEVTVAAALLHDVLDNTRLLEGQLRDMVGNDTVVDVVKQVSHVDELSSKYRSLPATSAEGQASMATSLVSMMVAMHSDPCALLIKLADRVHDMRTAAALPPATRNRLAQETRDVWAPLANRLGVWKLKALLEDLAFRQLQPEEYDSLQATLNAAHAEEGLQAVVDDIRDALASFPGGSIQPTELTARRKNAWGVWVKMQSKGYSLDRIHDVRGVRVIVETKHQCYEALRAIYAAFGHDSSREKNYIRCPKANNYQSLHTAVRGRDGHWVEVQIRTQAMHYLAEYGKDAAHWTYKEGGRQSISHRGAATDDGREASWAKYHASQQVSDLKCRPSGSPAQQAQWMSALVARSGSPTDGAAAGLVALAAEGAAAAAGQAQEGASSTDQRSGSPKRDFAEYLKWSGQALVPHSADRDLVCLVAAGGMEVRAVPKGTNLADFLAGCGPAAASAGAHVLVNRELEGGESGTVLHTGDIVEVYEDAPGTTQLAPATAWGGVDTPSCLVALPLTPRAVAQPAPVATPPVAAAPKLAAFAPTGNVVPLAGLSAKLRKAAAMPNR